MTTHPNTDPDAPAKTKPRGAERQVDRETRNPWFRWTLHFGAPMTISLIVHAAAVLLFSIATVVHATAPKETVTVTANPGTSMDSQASRHRKALETQIAAAREQLASLAAR